jgi:uncharacterized protein YebE (UPF0316 family)
MEIVFELLVLFVLKALDNLLSTGKQLLIQRQKPIIAALCVVLSQVIFYKLINEVSAFDGDLAIYIVAVASGAGTLLAVKISDRFSKDRIFVNVILSDDREAMVKLRNFLRDHHIINLAAEGFTKDWNKTIAITAYAETREQSRLIDRYIRESSTKFKRIIQKK